MRVEKRFFGTDGIRGRVGTYPINAEFVLKLGWAVGKVFSRNQQAKILIGKDTRVSGYMFEAALEAGLSAAGVDSRLLGPMPTPAIAYLTRTFRAQAGIVISASHNPYEDNGIKFFSGDGFKLPDSIEFEIESQLDEPMDTVSSRDLGKAKRIDDAPGRYIEFCKSTIGTDVKLDGLKIVVDCAHGATYHIAPLVLNELGADVIVIGAEPDGFNINANYGSTYLENLQEKVLAEKADLGIAFDGDGDRVMMVSSCGKIINGDDLVYIIAKERVAEKNILGGVVGTLMTNLGLEIALRGLGLEFKRTNVGDRYVLSELLTKRWILGGEASGHIINLDLNTTGDGIVSALQVLRALCKTEKSILELSNEYTKFPQIMKNVKLTNKTNLLQLPEIQTLIVTAEKKLGKRGRILVRESGTEPVIRVMAEGENELEVSQIVQSIVEVLEHRV